MWHRTVILSQKFAVAGVFKKENLPWPHAILNSILMLMLLSE